ncbi:hypothetical protein AZI86_11510 [Bdellovibrio bacteriovorus]|uniref:Methyltransferase small domain-containing protein n=2 Tax=Bdellovibrio bacteriovorus TaxID=959 RepID=A0A150WM90_BDEBC|nr:hypothetical protein AZI86_11510 [Bdellovibrio bacteriovorus]
MMTLMNPQIVIQVGEYLRAQGYEFTTVTPETHRRVLARPFNKMNLEDPKLALREFFGWNRSVKPDVLPMELVSILRNSDLLDSENGKIKSRLRFSTLDKNIYAHSSFPTDQETSVFFGPDSYRFVSFLKRHITSGNKVLDIGCGSGVGALSLSDRIDAQALCDVSESALVFAKANAILNACPNVEFYQSDVLKNAPHGADVLIANPPFIMDEQKRKYRDGGGQYGAEIALKIVQESLGYLNRLNHDGILALYTGSCIVNGKDMFLNEVKNIIPPTGYQLSYEEIDPDIFGEEMSQEPYREVERIAAVGLVLRKS